MSTKGSMPPPTTSPKKSPNHAERSRTLAACARLATLSTMSRDPEHYPFGSLVTVAFDGSGRPLLLLSRLAEHTQNIEHCANASILVTEVPARDAEPLALGRVTLLGACRLVPEADREAVRATFLVVHPEASAYVDFPDFAFYRLEPIAVRYVGGFGRMSWVDANEYQAAEPDPLAPFSADILTHMNQDHADAVLAYARVLAAVPSATAATMIRVDRYGFELAVIAPEGPASARLSFDAPVHTSDEVRRAMVTLVKRARSTS